MHQPSQDANLFRNVMLLLCVALPWLNPFTASPSAAVIPLLLSWMLSACALLLVAELPVVQVQWKKTSLGITIALSLWLLALLIFVPPVMDRALTMGLMASLLCIGLMIEVGRRAYLDASLLRWVTAAILLAALVSSVLGVLQYLGLAHDLSPWVNQPFKGDAFANLRQRNQFASLTSLGLVVVLAGLSVTPLTQQTRKTWFAALLAVNLLAAGMACSVSRTGALEWLLVGGLFATWSWHKDKNLRIFAVLAPVLVIVWSALMPWISYFVTGEMGASLIFRFSGHAQDYGMCGSRSVLWSNVLTMLSQHPLTGWGWGETDFAHFMTAYSGVRFCDMLDNAHNLPLHLALELGVPFAMAVLASIAIWGYLQKPWQEEHPWRKMAWALLLVLAVHSFLEYPLWYGPFQMTLGISIGLLGAQQNLRVKEQQPIATFLATALLFLGCLYAAWDFNRVGQIYRPQDQRDAVYQANPLGYAKQSWLFKNQAQFAELTISEVTPDNAKQMYAMAMQSLHYSPEARVVQRAIDSAKLLGYTAQAEMLQQQLAAQKKSQR